MAGVQLQSARVTDRGLAHDRRWMLIDPNKRFISQREIPTMALCQPAITDDGLIISYPGHTDLLIPFISETNTYVDVTVWDDTCRGVYASAEADAWFSKVLKTDCRLAYMPDDSRRPVDPKYAPGDKITSFSDAYPFLLIGEASIADLSERTGELIPMNRFRPNIVFAGGAPYTEDEMAHFRINDIDFYGVKDCARCPIPGISQETALRMKEPLKTLNSYRRRNNKVWMGQNLIHNGEGFLTIGDAINVLNTKSSAVYD